MFYSLKTTINTYSIIKERATVIEIFTLSLILISLIFFIVGFTFSLSTFNMLGIISTGLIELSTLFSLFSLIILIVNYVIHGEYFFHLPFPIYQIIIVDNQGLLIYNTSVSIINIPELDDTNKLLLSGYIEIITKIVKKILGSSTELKRIDTGLYQIYFSQIPDDNGVVMIIASGNSYYLQKSLNLFAKTISHYLSERSWGQTSLTKEFLEKIEELLLDSFPYLIIKKENNLP